MDGSLITTLYNGGMVKVFYLIIYSISQDLVRIFYTVNRAPNKALRSDPFGDTEHFRCFGGYRRTRPP